MVKKTIRDLIAQKERTSKGLQAMGIVFENTPKEKELPMPKQLRGITDEQIAQLAIAQLAIACAEFGPSAPTGKREIEIMRENLSNDREMLAEIENKSRFIESRQLESDEGVLEEYIALLARPTRNINQCLSKNQLRDTCKQLLAKNIILQKRLNAAESLLAQIAKEKENETNAR